MDTALTLHNFFNKDYNPLWKLRRIWESCLGLMEGMKVRSSHFFRKGNVPADTFSNVSLPYNSSVWWDDVISDIRTTVHNDRIGSCYKIVLICFLLFSF